MPAYAINRRQVCIILSHHTTTSFGCVTTAAFRSLLSKVESYQLKPGYSSTHLPMHVSCGPRCDATGDQVGTGAGLKTMFLSNQRTTINNNCNQGKHSCYLFFRLNGTNDHKHCDDRIDDTKPVTKTVIKRVSMLQQTSSVKVIALPAALLACIHPATIIIYG